MCFPVYVKGNLQYSIFDDLRVCKFEICGCLTVCKLMDKFLPLEGGGDAGKQAQASPQK